MRIPLREARVRARLLSIRIIRSAISSSRWIPDLRRDPHDQTRLVQLLGEPDCIFGVVCTDVLMFFA